MRRRGGTGYARQRSRIISVSVNTPTRGPRAVASGPTYDVSFSSAPTAEGDAIVFLITTTGVQNNTTMYWKNTGTTTAADFVENVNEGFITIRNNRGSFTLTTIADITTEGNETIQIQLYTHRPVTLTQVNVSDTSLTPEYTIIPNTNSIDETGEVTFAITTANVVNETILYWDNAGSASAKDMSDNIMSGSVTVINNSATITLTTTEDELTEGIETLQLRLRTGSLAGPVVAISAVIVTVIDSSTMPASISQSRFIRPANNTISSYMVKHKQDGGALIWGVNMTASLQCQIRGLARGLNGGVYALIGHNSSFVANNASTATDGTGSSSFTTTPTITNLDGAVISYSSSGSVRWLAKITGFALNVWSGNITSDSSGNVYIVFINYRNGGTIIHNSDDTIAISRPSESAHYIVKYNSDGFVQWGRRVSGSFGGEPPIGWYINADVSGNVYAGFRLGGPASIFASDYTTVIGSVATTSNVTSMVVKYDSNATYKWHISFTNNNIIQSLRTDSKGYLYYGSSRGGQSLIRDSNDATLFTLPSGTPNSAIVKIDPITPSVLSVLNFTNYDGHATAFDLSDNLYVLAKSSSVQFSNAGGGVTVGAPPTKFSSGTLCRYNADGIVQWAINIGYTGSGDNSEPFLETDASNNVYLHGSFSSTNFEYRDTANVNYYYFARVRNSCEVVTSKVSSAGVVQFVRRHTNGPTSVAASSAIHINSGNGLAISDRGNVFTGSSFAPFSNALSNWVVSSTDIVVSGSNPVFTVVA